MVVAAEETEVVRVVVHPMAAVGDHGDDHHHRRELEAWEGGLRARDWTRKGLKK